MIARLFFLVFYVAKGIIHAYRPATPLLHILGERGRSARKVGNLSKRAKVLGGGRVRGQPSVLMPVVVSSLF